MLYNHFSIPFAAQQGICKHIDKLFLFFQWPGRTLNSEVRTEQKILLQGQDYGFSTTGGRQKVSRSDFLPSKIHTCEKRSQVSTSRLLFVIWPPSPFFQFFSLAKIAQGQNTWSFVGEHYKVMQKVYLVIQQASHGSSYNIDA